MSSLLLEIVYVYPALSPPSLSAHASNRVCNALALLQCVASHPQTRSLFLSGRLNRQARKTTWLTPFLSAHIPLFLYPFLNTTSKTRPFEYLRLTSLGVIGALVKVSSFSKSCRQISMNGPLKACYPTATRQFRCHQLPTLHRNHPSLSPHHGVRIGALQNSRHFHRAKDTARRPRIGIYLSDIRTILRRRYRLELNGQQSGRFAGYSSAEACCQMLFEVE